MKAEDGRVSTAAPARVIGTALLLLAAASVGAGESWQVSFSPSYSAGVPEGAGRTGFLYLPLSVRRSFDWGDVSLIVPYLDFRESSVASRGLGDAGLRLRVHVREDGGPWPLVSTVLKVNAPTGDAARGTGYGTVSATTGLEVSKLVGSRLYLLGDASYTRTGNSEEYGVLERWEYAVGASVSLTSSNQTALSLYFEQWTPASPLLPEARDVLVHLGRAVRPSLRLHLAAQVPLSESAADFGVLGGVSVRF